MDIVGTGQHGPGHCASEMLEPGQIRAVFALRVDNSTRFLQVGRRNISRVFEDTMTTTGPGIIVRASRPSVE